IMGEQAAAYKCQKACKDGVPTKNTFVHYDLELVDREASGGGGAMKRVASCPCILADVECVQGSDEPESPKSVSGDSTMTNTTFGEEVVGFRSASSSKETSQSHWPPPSWQEQQAALSSNQNARGPALSPSAAYPSADDASPVEAKTALKCPAHLGASSSSCSQVAVQLEAFGLEPGEANQVRPKTASRKRKPVNMKKLINKEIMQALTGTEVLNVVAKRLSQMNGVNLATGFHRLARSNVAMEEVAESPTFARMLELAERSAKHEK
ncbi:unnamed protein product, partial [Symbiodinium pilosum]